MWWPVSVPCVLWGLDRKPTQARHQPCTGGRCGWLRRSQGTKSLLPALQVISAILGHFEKLACEISGLSWGYLWNSFFSVCAWFCFCLFLFNDFTGGKAWDPKPLNSQRCFWNDHFAVVAPKEAKSRSCPANRIGTGDWLVHKIEVIWILNTNIV